VYDVRRFVVSRKASALRDLHDIDNGATLSRFDREGRRV
jgi:hypothetical protein